MRTRLIGCEVLCRELSAAIARAERVVDAEFLPKGLHDQGADAMRLRIQEAIDVTDPARYQAIALGYGLCGNGLAGLVAREIPVVMPRAHDCIALLLGSHLSYQQIIADNPGTFFRSPGWVERGADMLQLSRELPVAETSLDALITRYGPDNGRYLYEEFHRYRQRYSKLIYIDTGVGKDAATEQRARDEAKRKGWGFAKTAGSLDWFQALLDGEWNESFLVLQPGQRSIAAYDGAILRAEPVAAAGEEVECSA